MSTNHVHYENSVPSNHVDLYVKAGKDGESYGACPFCQRFYMILDLKANAGELTYDVTTVNMARPPAEFKKLANRLPVLKHGDEIMSDNDEIVQYIDENFPHPDIRYDNMKAHSVCLDIFSKFSFYIKQVSHGPEGLLKELYCINDFLENAGSLYLCGEELTHLDCLMLPKLQHIRVAAKAFKDFDIPQEMKGIWRYLENAYKNNTFRKTCPSDQEIVFHWEDKQQTPLLTDEQKRFYAFDIEPRFCFNVPGEMNSLH